MRNPLESDIRVSVGKKELLDALMTNREQHRRIFEEACEGYRAKAVDILEQNIANIKVRKLERIHVNLPVPEDHTKDYDRVIRMVEMHQGESLELDQEHFAQYVMDDWGWRTSLLDTALFYGSETAKRIGAAE